MDGGHSRDSRTIGIAKEVYTYLQENSAELQCKRLYFGNLTLGNYLMCKCILDFHFQQDSLLKMHGIQKTT